MFRDADGGCDGGESDRACARVDGGLAARPNDGDVGRGCGRWSGGLRLRGNRWRSGLNLLGRGGLGLLRGRLSFLRCRGLGLLRGLRLTLGLRLTVCLRLTICRCLTLGLGGLLGPKLGGLFRPEVCRFNSASPGGGNHVLMLLKEVGCGWIGRRRLMLRNG